MIPRDLNCMLDEIQKTALIDLHVAAPGQIQSYDATTQTADIVLGHKHQVPDDHGAFQTEDPPLLNDVPVIFPRSGSAFLTFPLAAGDTVLVIFCDRSTDQWRAKGEQCSPADPEVMGMSGAVAIPGFFPDARALPSVSTTDTVLGVVNGVQVHVKPGGTVEVVSNGGTMTLDYVAMATKVDTFIDKIELLFSSWTLTPTEVSTGAIALKGLMTSIFATPTSTVASTNLKAN